MWLLWWLVRGGENSCYLLVIERKKDSLLDIALLILNNCNTKLSHFQFFVMFSCRFLPGSGELSICHDSPHNPTLSSGLSKIEKAIRWWRISLLPHRCRWQWKDKNWCVFWRLCPDHWQVWSSCHSLGVVSRSNCSPVREYCRRLQREEMRMKSTTEAKTCSSSFKFFQWYVVDQSVCGTIKVTSQSNRWKCILRESVITNRYFNYN